MIALGFVVPFKKIRRLFLVSGAALVLVTSMPATSKLFGMPLYKSVETYDAAKGQSLPIIVPTAGVYKDFDGRWWPGMESIFRFQEAKRFAGPLYLLGGNPADGAPAEAEVIASYFSTDQRPFVVVGSGRNSIESAQALTSIIKIDEGPVHLVTSVTHTFRMAAALRSQGYKVVATPLSSSMSTPLLLTDFLPGFPGLHVFRQISYEYLGVVLYLFRGDIGLKHLF